MPSASAQARARRRRRKLLLSATLATGAALWGARKSASIDDDTDGFDSTPVDSDPGDDVGNGREDKHDETLHDVWPG